MANCQNETNTALSDISDNTFQKYEMNNKFIIPYQGIKVNLKFVKS